MKRLERWSCHGHSTAFHVTAAPDPTSLAALRPEAGAESSSPNEVRQPVTVLAIQRQALASTLFVPIQPLKNLEAVYPRAWPRHPFSFVQWILSSYGPPGTVPH